MPESLGKMKHRHKQELKALEAQKAAFAKKNKSMPKKEVRAELARMEAELSERHEKELASLGDAAEPAAAAAADGASPAASGHAAGAAGAPAAAAAADSEAEPEPSALARKRNKAAARRAKKEEQARERELEIQRYAAELEAAGGSRRDREMRALNLRLSELGRAVKVMPADGSCMFHALADQLRGAGGSEGPEGGASVSDLRETAAAHLERHAERLGPFLPFEDADGDFATDPSQAVARYCSRLRNTALWGGQPEARAIAEALGRDVVIHRADSSPTVLSAADGDGGAEAGGAEAAAASGEDEAAAGGALHITFHLHFLSTGEHYNSAALTA
ncbi:hypothetical protein FNF31_03547 [Cafeteria roenbergensis]|uniref:OTU domain-containing protein n=1 Tax=Cafeteria roenbergensis TaxID=33653 RepID=A0A5A8DCP7_CAFRO|nr:hypothetical protein FNF31_03547 [Cafeteria roenbergensis]